MRKSALPLRTLTAKAFDVCVTFTACALLKVLELILVNWIK
jgi:hypothetical protein